MRWWSILIAAAVGSGGCVLDELDHEGQPCPCAEGWSCADAAPVPVCVSGPSSDGGADAGAPVDGGVDGASGADAGPVACGDGLLFCDGFEDGALAAWDLPVEAGGTVTATRAQARSGEWSLRAATTTNGGQAAVTSQTLGDVSAGDLWARAWVRVPSSQSLDNALVLSLGNAESGWVHAQLGPETAIRLLIGDDATAMRIDGADAFPLDAWFCLRLHVVVSDAGSAELYLGDATEPTAATTSAVDTLPAGNYEQVLVGVNYSLPAQGPIELFVDDVSVDDALLDCE